MRLHPRLFASVGVALVVAASALAQAPAPESATKASSLARYIPKAKLVGYFEFAGTDAHASAWGQTSASKILNDTPTGAMLEDLLTQALAAQFAKIPPKESTPPAASEVVAVLKFAARSGVVYATNAKAGAPKGAANTIVFPGAWRDDASKKTFTPLVKSLVPPGGKVQAAEKPGGRRVVVATHAGGAVEAAYWIENKTDLVITDDPDAVIAALTTPDSSFAGDPRRAALFAPEKGSEPIGGGLMELSGIGTGPSQAANFFTQMGVDPKSVQRLEYRLALRGADLVHDLRLVAPAPRAGTLALFDGPKFDAKAIPPMPEGVEEFSALSLDLPKLYGQIEAQARKSNPAADEAFKTAESTVKAKTRLDLRKDILGRLGPRMLLYTSPKKKDKEKSAGASNPLAALGLGTGGFQVAKGAMLIEIKDPKGATTMLDQLIIFANREMKVQMAAMAPSPPADTSGQPGRPARGKAAAPPAPEFKMATSNPKTYVLKLPTQFEAMTNLRLTIAVGKKYLVIGTLPEAAREALGVEGQATRKAPSGDAAKALEGLPSDMILLEVSDPSDTLPEALAALPDSINAILAPKPPAGADAAGAPGAAPAPGGGEQFAVGARRGGRGGQPESPSVSTGGPAGGGEQGAAPPPGGPGAPQNPPGAPGASGPVVRIDPAKIPQPDAVRKFIGPGSAALAADDQSIRLIVRHSFPDLGTWVALPSKIGGAAESMKAMKSGPPGMSGPPPGGPAPPGGIVPGRPGRRGGGAVGGID